MADIAINPVVRRVQFTGNTGLGPFAFTFNILQNTDIVVYKNRTLLTLTTDYTVSIDANGTGSVTLTGSGSGTALVADDVFTLIGGRELSRTTDFVTAGDLLASSLNEQLDSNVIMSQQLDERFSRTIRVNPGDADKTLEVPSVADRADKILKFDSSGNIGVETASALFSGAVVGANFTNNTFTGDGSQTAFTTTVQAGSKNNAQVYIDGVYQLKSSFSVSGTTLTFTEAPPPNSQIEVIIGNAIDTVDADSGNVNYNQGGTGAQTRTVENKLQDVVSVKDFGATGDGVTDDYDAILNAWTHCLANAKSLFFPAGTYLVDDKNYPFRQGGITPASLLDCKNIVIFGEGPNSILKTTSSDGADVLQINGVKNLHFKDLKVTATLTGFSGAGSNGVSITGGGDNITFTNVIAENMPYVEYPAYLDGGKGFTCQHTGINAPLGYIAFTNCIANGCVYGFDINPTLDDILTEKSVTRVENCIAENCWYGFLASSPAAGTAIPTGWSNNNFMQGAAINCQHSFVLGRVHGGTYDVNVINNKTKANLKLDPNGTAWSTTLSTEVENCSVSYAHNAKIHVHGYANNVDTKAAIGGTTAGSSGQTGATNACDIYIDIGGTADTADVADINSGGNTLSNSRLVVSKTTSSGTLPSQFYAAVNDNTIIFGNISSRFDTPKIEGALSFTYTDGVTSYNNITRDGLGLFAQQTGGSSPSTEVFGIKDNAGNKDFIFFNDGTIHTSGVASATSVSTVNSVWVVRDAAGTVIGYIPIYTSYS